MQLIWNLIVWKFLRFICFHKDWYRKRKCYSLLYPTHVNWLHSWTLCPIYLPERNRNDFVTSYRIYAGLHSAQSLLHSEQWYILASNIYVHFNLYSHFSSAVPLVMAEISFITASSKGHPCFEEKTGREKSSGGMSSKLICQGGVSMNFLLKYSDP